MVRSEAEGKAVLLTSKMPSAPDGKVYELWLQKDGVMVPAGLMPDKADQTVLLQRRRQRRHRRRHHRGARGGSDKPTSAPIALFELEASVNRPGRGRGESVWPAWWPPMSPRAPRT